jgi:trigger factor
VMQALLDATKVEVPKSLIESEVERLRELTRQDFAARGIPVKNDMPLPAEMFQQQAERRVNLGLILAEVVKANQLQAKPEQVRGIVEEQAQSYENPQEVVRWYYQSPERLREIESMVLEDNVVEWALKSAQIDEQSIDFDELMGNRK